jgi:hypothetical protein
MLALLLLTLAAPVPKGLAVGAAPNTNAVMIANAATFTVDSSSAYNGYPLKRLFDPADKEPFYFNAGDCPQSGKKPWARVSFETPVTVNRVTVLGNRDSAFPLGYFALEATIELLDADGKLLEKQDLKSAGDKHDFDYAPLTARSGVKAVRVIINRDERKSNCVGLSKVQVE